MSKKGAQPRVAVFTIVSKNYLHFARTLMDSLRTVHPGWTRFVLLVDEVRGDFDPKQEKFTLVEVSDLPLPDKQKFLFRYSILELNTAVKAWMIEYLFFQKSFERVVYLDPDIFVYRRMTEVEEPLDAGALMVLTPHLTGQLPDDKKPGESEIVKSGAYNLGFIALAAHPKLSSFLSWWKSKLELNCVVDIPAGLFVDQKWIDLAPGMFGGAHILLHEGYNVAYWNINHRNVERNETGFTVNGQPLVFFHFSGLNPRSPENFSKHQDRFQLRDLGVVRDLVLDYCRRVIANDLDTCITWNYAFARFGDGQAIHDLMRSHYRKDGNLQSVAGTDPFRLSSGYFNSPWGVTPRGEPVITLLMRLVWETRPDVQAYFPDIQGRHRFTFVYWFVHTGAGEHGIPDYYVEPARRSLSSNRGSDTGLVNRGIMKTAFWLNPIVRHIPASLRDRVKARVFTQTPLVSQTQIFTGSEPLPFGVNYSGFYDQEEFSSTPRSVWMGESASVRILPPLPGILTVKGEYDAKSHARAHGSPSVHLDVQINGATVGGFDLGTSGPFEQTIPLPDLHLEKKTTLTLSASHCFVPAKIGTNQDTRSLSLKIQQFGLNGETILDFDQADAPFMPGTTFGLGMGMNIIGYARSEHGLGESSRLAATAAEAASIPFCVYDFNIGNAARTNDDSWAHKFSTDNPYNLNLFHINADQMGIARGLLGDAFFRDRYNVGYWAWELPDFPERWLSAFACLDEVWAPSRFVVESITAKSPVPVIRMPHPIRCDVDPSVTRDDMGLPCDAFLFLCMYDMHSHQARKNPQAAIQAFRKAFPDPKNVHLIVKTQNVELHPVEFEELKLSVAGVPGVILLDTTLYRREVYNLENLCDCFVSLHRSEGFGIALAESMYLEKPVIGTNWSGNIDFMNYKNSCPVDYELVQITSNHGPYRKGQIWAEPDVEHAAWYMQNLINDPGWRSRIAGEGQYTIRTEYSPAAVGEMYRKRLRVISRW